MPNDGKTPLSTTTGQAPAELLTVLQERLFAEAAEEDLALLDEAARRWLAEQALQLLQKHLPGRAKVRVRRLSRGHAPKTLVGQTALLTLNDDMPFLVDSLLNHLNARGIGVRLLLHPILDVVRDAHGELRAIERRAGQAARLQARAESLIVLLLEPLDAEQARRLQEEVREILAEVHDVVLDWPAMRQRLQQMIEAWQELPPPVPVSELTEMLAFLQWLAEEHFVFLGARALKRGADGALRADGDGLGLLRKQALDELSGAECSDCACLTPCLPAGHDAPLLITKSAAISRVHRRVPMDLVIIRRYDVAGQEVGELRLLGLFTASAYVRAAQDIPLLRRKVMQAMRQSGVLAGSHRGKALLNILETFPRDDLFELDAAALADLALEVLRVQERPRPRLMIWRGCSPLFVSAFAFIPRERFSSQLREQVGELLETALGAKVVSFTPSFGEHAQVRVHFRLQLLQPDGWAEVDMQRLNAQLLDIVRTWEERLLAEMQAAFGAQRAERLWPLYRVAFSEGYKEAFGPRTALHDIEVLEELNGSQRVAVALYRAHADAADTVRLKLYHFDEAVALSARVPVLANMGLLAVEERTFTIQRGSGPRGTIRRGGHADDSHTVFVHEMLLRPADDVPLELEKVGALLEEGFLAVWNGRADDDRFNTLMLTAGLHWREVVVLRAVARWLRQAGVPYTLGYMADTLRRHASLARTFIEMFRALFTPEHRGAASRRRRAEELWQGVRAALAKVPSLDEDRILRMFGQVLLAMVRTSFFQPETLMEGSPRPFAFKLATQRLDFTPQPRPWAEVFVHDPALEGVHLRGGPIARGGIRFSDRPQDFRTEILGLMKAQTVKNAVIVPVGAKGGFVLRQPPADRAALKEQGEAAYRRFIGALLDITDNIADGRVVPPQKVVRLDDDDPYLVVAADKGTATFSDTANLLARVRGFWLDDAFASGGSAGYDHKKMGITARGAWVCVRRHFLEMDIDIDAQSISVIGIGDMSGDVFGNGMLIQPNIRLLAAFDHRDIFIDPDPDIAAAYRERQRLFRLPRSSWQDYDRAKISEGGGVFSRKAKSIPLTEQMKGLLGVQADTLTPNELIRAILKMQADLLFFGGIGTFVRAADERDSDVGDPASDAIRITAEELRVKVVGEGANLGMTQRARIAFARAGGRVNMDAIDNSAGVNTSDVEVNIKIALSPALRAGRLSRKARDALLAEMEEDVARIVLANNRAQHVCISMSVAQGAQEAQELQRLMQALQRRGMLNRQLEELPGEAELQARIDAGQGFSRPETAVLMSWAKIVLFDDLLACGVVDDAALCGWLRGYFPPPMQEKFAAEIERHQLRREIIANRLGNAMINLGGPAFVNRLAEETGRSLRDIATAFAVAMELFDVAALVGAVDQLDGRLKGEDQLRLRINLQHALRRACLWLLRHDAPEDGIATLRERYQPVIGWLNSALGQVATAHARERLRRRRQEFTEMGVPEKLARRLARLPWLLRGLDIALARRRVAEADTESKADLTRVAKVYFRIGRQLRLSAVIMAARRLRLDTHEERLAATRLVDRLTDLHVRLTAAACAQAPENAKAAVAAWMEDHAAAWARVQPMLQELLSGSFSLAKLALAASLYEEVVAV